MNRTAHRLIAIVFLTSGPLLAEPPSDDAIKALIANGKLAEAIDLCRARVAAQPNDPEGRVLLSSALFARARSSAPPPPDGRVAPISLSDAQAISAELELAAKLAPSRKDICLGLVDVWSAAGREEELLRQVRSCASQFPLDKKMMNGLLDFGFERQTRDDPLAGKILEAVQAGYPRVPEAILAWASWRLNSGNLEGAIQTLDAGATSTRDPDLLEALGDAYSYKLDFESAAKQYAKASSVDPKRRAVRLKWAVTLHLTDPKSAGLVAEPLRSEEKSGPATLRLSGDGSAANPSRIARAAGLLSRALAAPSFGASDAFSLAKSFWQSALPAPALVETEIALRKDPLHLESCMLRADIYTRTGLYVEALAMIGRAASIYDAAQGRSFAFSRDEVMVAQAAAESRLGRNEEALRTYRRTSSPTAYTYEMALLSERLGRIDEARTLLEQVVATGTKPAEVEAARTRLTQDLYRKKP